MSAAPPTGWSGSTRAFNRRLHAPARRRTSGACARRCARPGLVVVGVTALFVVSLMLYPLPRRRLLPAHRRRTVRDQRQVAVRHPDRGHRRRTSRKVEALVRRIVDPQDLDLIMSNIGVTPDFSAIYTSNAGSAHRHRPGRPERRAPDRQLRVHGSRARGASQQRAAAAERLLPVRRHGRRRAQSGPAGADRRAGQRRRTSTSRIDAGERSGAKDPGAARRQRRLHPAGSRLSRRCGSTSIASAPTSWARTSARWSRT